MKVIDRLVHQYLWLYKIILFFKFYKKYELSFLCNRCHGLVGDMLWKSHNNRLEGDLFDIKYQCPVCGINRTGQNEKFIREITDGYSVGSYIVVARNLKEAIQRSRYVKVGGQSD